MTGDDRQYLVTCKHVFKDPLNGLDLDVESEYVELKISASFEDIRKTEQSDQSIDRLSYRFVGFGSQGSDIAVLAIESALDNLHDIQIFGESGAASIVLGGEVGLLGFPSAIPMGDTSLKMHTGGFVPAVQRGYVSYFGDGDSPKVFYIAAMNSCGFSGGPVYVGEPGAGATLCGIVAGYRPQHKSVLQEGEETGMYVLGNTGIMTATYISHAIDAIRANPIG